MAENKKNETVNPEVKEAEVPAEGNTPEEPKKENWFKRTFTKKNVLGAVKTGAKVALTGCEVVATVGGAILGALVIAGAVNGFRKDDSEAIDTTAVEVLPEADEPTTEEGADEN